MKPKSLPPQPSPEADASWIGGTEPIRPIAFIAHAGEGLKVVEIWEIKNATAPLNPNAFMVAAYERGRERWVGVMDLRIARVEDAGAYCREDIETFAKSSRKTSSSKVMLVEGAFLSPIFKGRGIGVEMYIAAAALARRLGMAISADSCFDATTSDVEQVERLTPSPGWLRSPPAVRSVVR